MFGMGEIEVIFTLIIGFIIVIIPVKMAAATLDAEFSDFGACFLALLAATILQMLGASFFPIYGNIIAFLLSALAFSMILGTTFFGGIGIAVLHIVFSFLIGLALSLFGFSAFAGMKLSDLWQIITGLF